MKSKFIYIFFCFFTFSIIKHVLNKIGCDLSETTNCTCGTRIEVENVTRGRIRGADTVDIKQFPWIAQVWNKNDFVGAATLINNLFLVSAASAFYVFDVRTGDLLYDKRRAELTLYMGTPFADPDAVSGTYDSAGVKQVILHEQYNPYVRGVNDIAIIERNNDLKNYTDTYLPICLSPPHINYEGQYAETAGWGSSKDGANHNKNLLWANKVKILRDEDCVIFYNMPNYDTELDLCALQEYYIPCDFDAGGPLVLRWRGDEFVLVGVVTYNTNCSAAINPNIYTRVTAYLEWIYNITRNANYCENNSPRLKILVRNCICGVTSNPVDTSLGRIVGGERVLKNEFPYVAVLANFYCDIPRTYIGTGTLINDHYVLTTASVVYTKDVKTEIIDKDNRNNLMYAQFGVHNFSKNDGIIKTIGIIRYHPNYTGILKDGYDICLMKLEEPFTNYVSSVIPACLPVFPTSFEDVVGTIVSFGQRGPNTNNSLHENTLMKAYARTRKNDKCLEERQDFEPLSMMCAYGYRVAACGGDSGAPLLYKANEFQYIVVGMISFGDYCLIQNITTVLTRVSAHIKWIWDETKDGIYCENDLP